MRNELQEEFLVHQQTTVIEQLKSLHRNLD